MLRNYTSSFSDTELDFLKFHEHKNVCGRGGRGGKIPRPGIFTLTLYFLICQAKSYLD